MNDLNLNKRIKQSIYLSLPLFLLTFTEYYWQQISEFAPPIGMTIIFILILLVIIKFLSTCITIIKKLRSINYKLILPTIFYGATLLIIFINPQFLHAESYQPTELYRGCYEGTMNTGTIIFREKGKFEYRHVGFMGITTFKNGSWTKNGDTLIVNYKNTPSELVGTKLLMTDKRFIKIVDDSLYTEEWGFYRGNCLGLN